jgi:hypothetical protein
MRDRRSDYHMHRRGNRGVRRAAGLITAAVLAVAPLTVATTAAAGTTAGRVAPPAPGPGGLLARRLLSGLGARDASAGDAWLAAGVGPLAGRTGLAASSAGADYALQTGQISVRRDGHTWGLSVQAFSGPGGPALAEIDMTTPRRLGTEDHSWLFEDLPERDISAHRATGRESVDARSDLSPYARLSLAFTPTSHTAATCANSFYVGTTYTGRVTGTLRLVTGLDGVTVSRARVSFGRSSSLDVLRRFCDRPTPCTYDDWTVGSQARPNFFALGLQEGRPGDERFSAVLERLTVLSNARQIIRVDGATMTTATPAFSPRRRRLVITTSRAGVITGSAVIRRGVFQGAEPGDCTVGHTTYRVGANGYLGQYVSAVGQRIVAHLFLAPLFIGRRGIAAFDIVTSVRRVKQRVK